MTELFICLLIAQMSGLYKTGTFPLSKPGRDRLKLWSVRFLLFTEQIRVFSKWMQALGDKNLAKLTTRGGEDKSCHHKNVYLLEIP